MKDYTEVAKRYNQLVRKYNSKIIRLKELSADNQRLKSEVDRLEQKKNDLLRTLGTYEKSIVDLMVRICKGESESTQLLGTLDSMALSDKDGTICITSLSLSDRAKEYAQGKGLTILEEPKASFDGAVGTYKNI